MATYSDYEQRQLDQDSGADLDRREETSRQRFERTLRDVRARLGSLVQADRNHWHGDCLCRWCIYIRPILKDCDKALGEQGKPRG